MTITVRLPQALEAELRTRLDANGVGLSEFVREAITEKLEREGASKKRTPYEFGRHLFGKYSSGRDDLSANRKAILHEILSAKHRR